jgi:hypothetical protein
MDYSKDFPLFLKVSALVFYFVSALVIFLKKNKRPMGQDVKPCPENPPVMGEMSNVRCSERGV